MATRFVHTCVRVRDIDAAQRFYEALGFERRGKLQFRTAYNVYMGLPGDGDTLELTVNEGREEPGGREDVGRICFVADPDGYRIELIDGGRFKTPQDA
jgi:lactoylglutathione lyase